MSENTSDAFHLSLTGFLDFIPAVSGLIGKIALASSFAYVWAQELGISSPSFVFENVRLEVIIGSTVALLSAIALPNIAPPGTLAPLIVMIPTMARFGVHPFILSIMIGIIGIVSVKTKLFEKLVDICGSIGRSSLALVFGVSGVIMCIKNLLLFFSGNLMHFLTLIVLLGATYGILYLIKQAWLIIPVAAFFSLLLPYSFGMRFDLHTASDPVNFSPFYWWNDMWQTGFGLNSLTMLKTLPFAIFAILLWAIDTVSITALIDTNYSNKEKKAEIDLNKSFIIVAIRNIAGGLCGGAQTSSLWRSFLIPLFMMKRPIRQAAILLGILGILAGVTSLPIKVMSFPPLVWSVLLFGIFVPFVIAGIKTMGKIETFAQKSATIVFAAAGIIFSPILTWVASICLEKIMSRKHIVK